MDDLALASRAVIRRLGRPLRLVASNGRSVDLIGHLRGLRPAEIVGVYQEADVLVVLPADDLPADLRPARLDRIEAEGAVLSFIEHPRAVYAGARLVSFKGVARGRI